MATVLVTNSMAQRWGTDEAQLYKLAHSNTKLLDCGIVLTVYDVMDDTQE